MKDEEINKCKEAVEEYNKTVSIVKDIISMTMQSSFIFLSQKISATYKFIDTVLAGLMIIITSANVLIAATTTGLDLRVIVTIIFPLAFIGLITWYYKPRLEKGFNESMTSITHQIKQLDDIRLKYAKLLNNYQSQIDYCYQELCKNKKDLLDPTLCDTLDALKSS